jgi:hypothetical protein
MTERDEEGRPVATPHAGAFLGPFTGVPPVPSSVIDQRGASVEPVDEAELERRGPRETTPEPARPATTTRSGWVLACTTAVAIWAIGYALLYLVLDATSWVTDQRGSTAGTNLLKLLHWEGFQLAAYAALLLSAIRVGASFLPIRGTRVWAVLGAASALGALVIAYVVITNGNHAALLAIACGLVWLAAAYQMRPL